jgi:hypothetical protein
MKNMFRPLTEEERARLRRAIDEHGEVKVSAATGLGRATISRQLAGLKGHPSSALALRLYLTQCV